MPRFVWKRTHTIVATTTAAVLASGGIATAVALNNAEVAGTVPSPSAPAASSTPSRPTAPKPTPTPASPKPSAPKTDPLTGGKPGHDEVLAVKIENIAAARPQAGVSDADIVFVEEVEASLTRLIAVYSSHYPHRVGPVRSARNTDAQLLPLFGRPGLVYSGANRRVQRNVDSSSIKPLLRSTRDPSRSAPHNVFVDLAAVAKSQKVGRETSIGWTFAAKDARWSRASRAGRPAGQVGADRMSFDWRGGRYTVRWNGKTYDGGGTARTDNVIVLRVQNRRDGNADVNGVASVKSETVGHGRVTVYRDGRKISGSWIRRAKSGPMLLQDAHGDAIPLKPGQSWVLLSG